MDNSLYFIAVIFLILAALLALFFYRMNFSLKSKHELRCDELRNCFHAHQDQIEFRQITLGAYDFDRFNLSQVLQKQKLVQCL